MTSLPQDWTCAILDKAGVPVGVGVLVKPWNVVTCTHVVVEALKLTTLSTVPPAETIFLRTFRRSERRSARVIAWRLPDETFGDRFQDLCLLEILEAEPGLSSATWNELRQQEPRRRNIVRVFGYPVPPGKMSIGSVLVDEVAGGWWQLEPPPKPEAGFVAIGKGFSGSLAWDTEEDKAIGVVAAKAGETTYVIPSDLVYEAFFPPASEPGPEPPRPTGPAPASSPAAIADPAHSPHDVFLCHASADKPVVRALANALDAHGIRVWLDERELVPGRPWQEALERAIRTVRSAAVLVGPSGIGPWADREMRAFLDEFVRRAVPVIPVLLPGVRAKPDLPPFLAAFTWVDLRAGLTADGLEHLRWGITGNRDATSSQAPAPPPVASTTTAPLFKLWNVPLLPETYLPRPEIEDLKRSLSSAEQRPLALTGARPHLAVQGMGGVGKSVLAAALAREPEIRRAFPDGVYWLAIGQAPGDPTDALTRLFAAVRGDREPVTFKSAGEAAAALREMLSNRAILLVLDDIWDAAHVEPFNVLGEHCKLLLTTRSEEVTRSVGADSRVLDTLGEGDALDLLARYAGVARADLPADALELARACGELPLALAMVGSRLRDKPPNRWRAVVESLHAADLARLQARLPGYPHTSLLAAMQTSFDDLPSILQPRYLELAVFPEDTPIPESTLATYWRPEGLREGNVHDAIDTFVARSLARRDGQDRIVLHDLQRDFVRARAAETGLRLDERLVASYRAAAPAGLHAGPDDGYFFQHIAAHLLAAEGRAALRNLLFNPRWLAAKLAASDSTSMLADFDALGDLEPDDAARSLRDAVRLSAHVLDDRPEELGGQLIGRLLAIAGTAPEIQNLIAATVREMPRPALVPSWPCLDAPGGSLTRTLEGHQNWVTAVAVTPDGKTAVSASSDKTLKVWDLASGKNVRSLEGHQNWVTAVAVTPDGKTAVSTSDDRVLKVWDLASGKNVRSLEGHQDWVTAVAVTPDGKTAVSASKDKTLKVWDLASGKNVRSLEGHQASVTAVAITPDGEIAVSASKDRTLKIWDLASGRSLRSLEGHQSLVTAVAVTPDGEVAVSASNDKTLKVWDLASGKNVRSLEGHQDWVTAVAVTPDGKTAVSASHDKTLKVWDLASGKPLRSLEGHQNWIAAVAVTPDGKTAVSASHDKTLKVWDLASGNFWSLEGHQASVSAVAVTPDGEVAVSASNDETLKVWDLASGKNFQSLEGHHGWITAVAVTSDGEVAVSASKDKTLKVWDLASGKNVRSLEGHQDWVTAVAVTPDGKTAVSASSDKTLKVWDLASGKNLRSLEGHRDWVTAVGVTSDGKIAVSASGDRTMKVWDLLSGKNLRSLKGHQDGVTAVAVTPDGKTAVSASKDKTLKVWDLASGKNLRSLEGHHSSVHSTAVTPDGKTAVSGSGDKTLKVWDLASGALRASFTADAAVRAVALTSGGARLIAGDHLGRVHLHQIILENASEVEHDVRSNLPDPSVALQAVLAQLTIPERDALRAKLALIARDIERGQVRAISEFHAGRLRTVEDIWNNFLPCAEGLRRDIVRAAFVTNVRDDEALTRFVRDQFHHLMASFARSISHLTRSRNPGLQMRTIANLSARASMIAAQAGDIVTSMRWDLRSVEPPKKIGRPDGPIGHANRRSQALLVTHDFLENAGILQRLRRDGYQVALPVKSRLSALRRESWEIAILDHAGFSTSFEVKSGDSNDPHVLVMRRHPELTYEQAVRAARMLGPNVLFSGIDGDYQVSRVEPLSSIGNGPPATTRFTVLGRGRTRNETLLAAGVELPDET